MNHEAPTPPRRRMSFFTNSFDTNLKPDIPTSSTPQPTAATTPNFFARHPPSEVLLAILLHVFAPNAYIQTTSKIQPYSNTPFMITEDYRMIVDDDYVLVEEERRRQKDEEEIDGGPLCREAAIEKWKTEGRRERKRSFIEGAWKGW